MNAKQFMRLFALKTDIMLDREDSEMWIQIIKEFKHHDYDVAKAELLKIISREGKDKPRLYYIQGVRRNLIQQRHEENKKAPVAPQLKEIMKGMFS